MRIDQVLIEHFTSDCQINANLEANKDTDFFFLANSKSQNVNQCEEPTTVEDNHPPSIPSQKDNVEDYNKYRLSHMQYTEDNSVDNSNAWRQFEREKICFHFRSRILLQGTNSKKH